MRFRVVFFVTMAAIVAGASVLLAAPAARKSGPKLKYTVKQVMKEAIKGHTALVKKACAGTATPAELDRMIAYFQAMAECEPPQGDPASWKKKTTELHEAALALKKTPQDQEASYRLERAVECRQCHTPHKPK